MPGRLSSNGFGPGRPLRVAMIWPGEALDRAALSGMPASMASALGARGLDLVHLGAPRSALSCRSIRSYVPGRLRSAARPVVGAARDVRERLDERGTTERILARARASGEALSGRLAGVEADVVFGCCISTSLAFLRTALPIVYFSDATPRIINTTYPAYVRRSGGYHAACDQLEARALARTDFAAFACDAARRSAVAEYALDPARAWVIPMGANITPDRPVPVPRPAPSRGDVRLCFIGADPVRKRLDVCVRAAELLCEQGWRATLRVVGPLTRRAARSRVVEHVGRPSLADEPGRARVRGMLADSHLLLLPSVGEAFGIAPCEAAHFGVPSLVSDTGGLPSVVADGVTGRVLPVGAGPGEYARAVAELAEEPERYAAWSGAALARARETLSWSVWGDRVQALLDRAARGSVEARVLCGS